MFQFTAYSFDWLAIHQSIMHRCIGFPHSDISGSLRTYRSPKLFVVRHVLHRLLVPRHSPCALFYLTLLKNSLLGRLAICSLWLSRFFAWIIFSFQCTSSLILSDQWRLTGSNRWPPACKAGALPTELSPQGLFFFQPDITLALFCRYVNGPKWTWTIDLTLIRRAL